MIRSSRPLPRTERGLALDGQGRGALAADDNYATAWRPEPGQAPMLTADLGAVRTLRESQIRPAFAIQPQDLRIEASWMARPGVRSRRKRA